MLGSVFTGLEDISIEVSVACSDTTKSELVAVIFWMSHSEELVKKTDFDKDS